MVSRGVSLPPPWGIGVAWLDAKIDPVGELGGVGPTPPRGRDKSGPYAPAIASLGMPTVPCMQKSYAHP